MTQIRELAEGDDLEAELDLRHRSFGPMPPGGRPGWLDDLAATVRDGRMIGAFDGGTLVGTARWHDMRQWWHGRSLPMAGVAGVKTAPEERGRGTGSAMMRRLLELMAGRGYPVSTLFAYTAPMYRALGWEVAGGVHETVLPVRLLKSLLPPETGPLPPPPALHRAGPADAEAVIELTGRVHQQARDCGPTTRDVHTVRRWLGDDDSFNYLADDGFLGYGWQGGADELRVDELLAGSAQTARALWGIVASHATVASTVRAFLGPQDPISWLAGQAPEVTRRGTWMLRVIDAPAAIAARGFPPVTLSVPVQLQDEVLPANAGLWNLEIDGGQGMLEPGKTAPGKTGLPGHLPAVPPVRLGARGFAAMYAGTPLATLRRAGLAADGDPAADAALDCAFAGTAFMVDEF